MGKLFAGVLGFLGSVTAGLGSQACIVGFWDEPVSPKSLIK